MPEYTDIVQGFMDMIAAPSKKREAKASRFKSHPMILTYGSENAGYPA